MLAASAPRHACAVGVTPPEAAERLAHAAQLDAALADSELHGLGLSLLECLEGAHLDLTRLPQGIGYLVPLGAWEVLARHGVTQLTLPAPRDNEELQSVLPGLNALPVLEQLTVGAPMRGEIIELHKLDGRPGLSIMMDCGRVAGWRVTAPPRAHVRAIGACAQQLHSPEATVEYLEADGRTTGTRIVLAGLWRVRRHADARGAVDLNGQARFGSGERHREGLMQDTIVCRHLSLQWLMNRAADVESSAPRGRRGFASSKDITQQVAGAVNKSYYRLSRGEARPVALCTRGGFVALLRHLFDSMQPGQARRFALVTHTHVLGLELQMAAGSPDAWGGREHVVTLYDPNDTAAEYVLVVHDAQHLVHSDIPFCASYFYPDALQVMAAYAFDRPASELAAPATRCFGLHDARLSDPSHLFVAMKVGCTKLIHGGVQHLLGTTGLSREDRLRALVSEVRTSGDRVASSALDIGLEFGRCDAVAFYVDALVHAPADVLTDEERCAILLTGGLEEATGRRSVMLDLLQYPSCPQAPALYARLLLEAARSRCGLRIRLSQGDGAGWPRALAIAAITPTRGAPLPPSVSGSRDTNIYAVVLEVIASKHLSPADKENFLRWALPLRPRPSAAAAMACAILDAGIDARWQVRLLRAMRFDFAATARRLVERPRHADLDWLRRILHAMPESALSWPERRLADSLQVLLKNFVRPHARPPLQELLSAPGVQVTATDHDEDSFRRHGLRALRVDRNPGWMVCDAEVALEGLEPYRLRPGMRAGACGDGGRILYLLAVERLRPRQRSRLEAAGGAVATGPLPDTTPAAPGPGEPRRAHFGSPARKAPPRPASEAASGGKALRTEADAAARWHVVDAADLGSRRR
ncbi:ShET2/EspL2 family type III secretion system effector toxin [Ramlibacter rhizophilus]|uniref:ShET2/EspL2 family type III secretion system effector toxin n=1 Tax=Ramlibacter rhizophilus TaxID=1781167 RepID=A0A4Z0BVI7_9BURK|nr:ShET2/EspL2 family type III secretion system effector toxin [Ramlibacter rhizophilus]TFZ03313.1 ShET2/EspL2 family type III secretion system effector toxin [Ramlibacter rhizophilus]